MNEMTANLASHSPSIAAVSFLFIFYLFDFPLTTHKDKTKRNK